MKAPHYLMALLAIFRATGYAQAYHVQEAVTSALNWHYRWIEPMPRKLASIECSAALFTEKSFVLCEPIALSMNIETPGNRAPRVTYMGNEPATFDVALSAFRRNINPSGQFVGSVRKFSIAVRNLRACTIDSKLTARARSAVLTTEVRTAMLSSGHSFRFPVICEGDPFYLLYCLTGERILWIWLYEVNGDKFGFRWSFDSGTQQRRPPERAIANLNNKELWYKLEGGRK